MFVTYFDYGRFTHFRLIQFGTDIHGVILIGNIPIENFGSLPLLVFKWVLGSRIEEAFNNIGTINDPHGTKVLYPKVMDITIFYYRD